MARLPALWRDYWFRPGHLIDLAAVRIVLVGFQLSHLIRRDLLSGLEARLGLPEQLYEPLLIPHLLFTSLIGSAPPPFERIEIVVWVTFVAGGLALIGLLTNVSLGLFALGNLILVGALYSFGDFHHPEAILLLALVALALSPCGRVLSADSLIRRRLGDRADGAIEPGRSLDATSRFARWPLLLTGWLLGLAYLSAAYLKLRSGNLDWANGHTLQYYLIRDGLRWDMELGVWLGHQHGLVTVLSWLTLAFEGTFWLILLVPALAWVYVPLGAGLHWGIDLTMAAPFLQFIACYSVFVPWRRLLLSTHGKLASRLSPEPGETIG